MANNNEKLLQQICEVVDAGDYAAARMLLLQFVALSDQDAVYKQTVRLLSNYLPIFAQSLVRYDAWTQAYANLEESFLAYSERRNEKPSVFDVGVNYPYGSWSDASFLSAVTYLLHAKDNSDSPGQFITGVSSACLKYIDSRLVNIWEKDYPLAAQASGILSESLDKNLSAKILSAFEHLSTITPAEYLVRHNLGSHCTASPVQRREWLLLVDCMRSVPSRVLPIDIDIDLLADSWSKAEFTPLVS